MLIPAPEGFDAQATYDDGTRAYRVFARPSGAHFWTNCGVLGHAGMSVADLIALAIPVVDEHIRLGMVK
jgi:hypothetical protein